MVTTVKVLYKRIFLRSDNDQKHAQKAVLSVVEATLFLGDRSTRRHQAQQFYYPHCDLSSSAVEIYNFCDLVPTRLPIFNIFLNAKAINLASTFEADTRLNITSYGPFKFISEKKDLFTRGSRLCGIWIGIQHLQENFSCSCASFSRFIVTHANRRGIAYPNSMCKEGSVSSLESGYYQRSIIIDTNAPLPYKQ